MVSLQWTQSRVINLGYFTVATYLSCAEKVIVLNF